MAQIFTEEVLVLDINAHPNVSDPLYVANYKCAKFRVVASEDYNGTLKFMGTDTDSVRPDFSIPASDANPYSPILVIDYDSGNGIPGSTGIPFLPSGNGTINYSNLANGPFTPGETITGGTSGTTAVVVSDDGVSVLVINTITGTGFQVGEQITGGTSTATADVDSIVFADLISSYELSSNGEKIVGLKDVDVTQGTLKVYMKLYADA